MEFRVTKHGGFQNKLGSNNLVLVLKQESMEYMIKKRVWFEVKLQGAQGDREAEVFQVSNDDTAVAQRRLEDKQPEEKTNTDCLVKEQEKEYQTGWKIKTVIQQQNGLVKETNVTLLAKVRCFLIQSVLSKVFWAKNITMSTYLVTRSPSSAIGFKTPIDMLGFFGWLASIKQGMLEPVKVKCIFLGYRKRNMGFNESGEYKKTFIGSGVGTGSMQVLQGDEFEVELQDGHTFEVEPHENVDHVVGLQEVQTQDLIYYHPTRDREQHSVWELFSIEKTFACEVTDSDAITWESLYPQLWRSGRRVFDSGVGGIQTGEYLTEDFVEDFDCFTLWVDQIDEDGEAESYSKLDERSRRKSLTEEIALRRLSDTQNLQVAAFLLDI
ncbi:hypothetical protein Tco_0700704 [Tanacetum coccineum]